MKKKLFFIFNPKAGKAMIPARLYDIVDVFVKGGYEVVVYPTQGPGDAPLQVQKASQWADVIVCSGGDGTLDETVAGSFLADRKVPIGYIPAGSTNDFASSLQISRDMTRAAQQIVDGRAIPVDVGAFNDKNFIYVAAFGIFTEVSYQTDQTMKNILGYVAYLLEGAKHIFDIKTYHLKVFANDQSIEGEFIYGMVTNSKSVGGFKNLTGKHVYLDDGYFEVTLIHAPKNPMELNEIITSLLTQEDNTDYINSFKTNRLEILSQEPISWTLDGEFGGSPTELVIENRKQSLSILLSPEDADSLPLSGGDVGEVSDHELKL